ncbi:MAG: sigma factor-like helix-turn-helix DNA-binding protein [Lachnospiraceae bacterium]|nr:sigma factor-like helix-turn-helix DNA-binding protein [Lachnospiraceae bacterium]
MKPHYDQIARRYFYEEQKPEEIARETGQNEKTIRTQIYRAREMLRIIYRGGDIHDRAGT